MQGLQINRLHNRDVMDLCWKGWGEFTRKQKKKKHAAVYVMWIKLSATQKVLL